MDYMAGFERLAGTLKEAFGSAASGVKAAPEQALKAGAEMAVEGVTQNSGMTGQAAQSIQNYNQRQAQAMREMGL